MGWIQSISGRKVSVINPDASMIDIDDIAHALSMLCRFNGHGRSFYSVAEHSVHTSHEIAPELAFVGLLHDAAEAYIGDVPAPLKRYLSDFQAYEAKMEAAVAEHFGVLVQDFYCAELKRADTQLLVDEKTALMVPEPEPWPPNAPPPKRPERIEAWPQHVAKQRFLERFAELSSSVVL
jgi:uncharacterized protein